jgi:hypothetical protein
MSLPYGDKEALMRTRFPFARLSVLALIALALQPDARAQDPIPQPPVRSSDQVQARLEASVGNWSWVGLSDDGTKVLATCHRIRRGPGQSFLWSAEWGTGNVLWQAQVWKTDEGTWRLHMLGMHGQPIEGTVTAEGDRAIALSWSHREPGGEGRQGFVAWIEGVELRTKYVTWHSDGRREETEPGRNRAGPERTLRPW